jgi:hypothetical protein
MEKMAHSLYNGKLGSHNWWQPDGSRASIAFCDLLCNLLVSVDMYIIYSFEIILN